MKKIALSLFLFLFLAAQAPQVLALEIQINPNGTIFIYEDGVLGDRNEFGNPGKGEDKKAEQAEKREDKKSEDRQPSESSQPPTPSTSEPIKTVPSQPEKVIKVETEGKSIKVNIEKETKTPTGHTVTEKEEMKTERFRLITPSSPAGQFIQTRESQFSQIEAQLEKRQQAVRQDRQDRPGEVVELRNQVDGRGQQTLELLSRVTKASVVAGAAFEVDPTTNQIRMTTPVGSTQTLEHLPDQAVAQMKAAGLVSDTIDNDTIVLGTNAQGEVVYRASGSRQKRVFGLFKRSVSTQIELNDATGEVVENEIGSPSLFGQFLDAISF